MQCGGIDAAELAFVYSDSRDQRLDRSLEVEEVQFAIVGCAESPQWLPPAGNDHPQDVHLAWQLIR
jgi:hypothetical protein